ncbi:hypothetical protein RUM4293_04590 [Ruegeria atlantica]|uniref:Uncharacterized protein n=1 Tax=Ruegeria atlantica TaxID=81569 RepID=A0A0P1E963_9RHOB|nr:hypothetical protein RUM4293_04590 [Ruegeria atlantica]
MGIGPRLKGYADLRAGDEYRSIAVTFAQAQAMKKPAAGSAAGFFILSPEG